jgi:acetylglutamate kinase
MEKETVTIKIGGQAATDAESLALLVREIGALVSSYSFIVVHGGGAEVSRVSKIFGLEPSFVDGVRMTTPAEMDVVDMVLAGKVNKWLVRMFQQAGANAVGLSGVDGRTFVGESIGGPAPDATRTGRVMGVAPALVNLLVSEGYVPVLSSVSMDATGQALNINADEAAFHLAAAIPSSYLVFLSDIPGVLKDDEVIRVLSPGAAEQEIDSGTISGGMIPKVRSSLGALGRGVREVIIGAYHGVGHLTGLLEGSRGTRIIAE